MTYLVIGRRGLGKTTLARYITLQCGKRIVFDPRGMIASASARVVDAADLDDAFAQLATGHASEVVVTPDADPMSIFPAWCECARGYVRGGFTTERVGVLIDEARLVALSRGAAPAFDWLVRCTPRGGVHLVITCHRPVDVPADVRAIVDQWCMFRCTHDGDLKLIAEHCSDDVARAVSRLPPHHWMQWDDGRGLSFTHAEPAAWFVPLGGSTVALTGEISPLETLPTNAFDRPRQLRLE